MLEDNDGSDDDEPDSSSWGERLGGLESEINASRREQALVCEASGVVRACVREVCGLEQGPRRVYGRIASYGRSGLSV